MAIVPVLFGDGLRCAGRGGAILRDVSVLRFLFGLDVPVSRGQYAAAGLSLAALKYGVEGAAIYGTLGTWPSPLDYLNPLLSARLDMVKGADWLLWPMALWTVPFLWIGFSMTFRRLVDAGGWPFLSYVYFIPLINYLGMLALCLLPPRPQVPQLVARDIAGERPGERVRAALVGMLAGVGTTLLATGASVLAFGSYGSTLFLGAPVMMGAASGFLFNRARPRPLGTTLAVATLSVLLAGGCLLLFALEGVLCLLMAAPLGILMALMGAVVGRVAAIHRWADLGQLVIAVLSLPVLAGFEEARPEHKPFEVTTVIDVSVPPAKTWRHVIEFSEIPPPGDLLLRTGIAYPVRAHIDGRGVGAIRHCEFSTGAFVEPITVWRPPSRLSFHVIAQPPPMHEWSPYRRVHAPHLDGYMRSVRGEFRLEERPGGGTRLYGTTWYHLDVFPSVYWSLWSDAIVHAIHARVLEHIKSRAEALGG